MKTRELKELKLTKNIIIPFPNFQQNTIISPTQMNDNFEEIEYAYNNLIDNHNGALEKINKVLSDLTSSDNEAIVNEQERIEAEEIRVNNEEERIANEEERKTEETKRIAMYNVHLNDEIRREQKHIQMVGEFDTKVGEVDTLISTKTEEYNTFVETKEVEIQNAINSIPPKSELIGEKGDKGDKGEKGDKGDRGEQGLQGIQGIQGLQGVKGDKGDKGDKGEQGIQGLKGDKGDKGDRGEQGVKGDTPSITHLETSINNKIQEVETRFNTLTSTQQQSSEVIDARDGETSLKARLDRDIEKAKQVYVNVEGSHISTDSNVGYAKDVEIKGNTIQDASNLADIRSVGDKVEGQELYEIPVLSCGKNLFDISKMIIPSEWYGVWSPQLNLSDFGIVSGKTYYFDVGVRVRFYNNSSMVLEIGFGNKTYASIPTYDKVVFDTYIPDMTLEQYKEKLKISYIIEGNKPMYTYEPYQEDKLTILSPVQLEKVGDVRDRIIEKDGVWGVEKNVDNIVFNGSEQWQYNSNTKEFYLTKNNYIYDGNYGCICDKFTYGETGGNYNNVIRLGQAIFVSLRKDDITNVNDFKAWLQNNNVLVMFITPQPQFIPLPHDQQVKLRTFASKTNISFLTEIEGTIKAQVPKSLGATVNTHTEQINNLNKELDRVKKLEESTVSTVTTESDFTTVEATSNGYFEDVKLEGKTLVNLFTRKQTWNVGGSDLTTWSANIRVEVGKQYTLIVKGLNEAKANGEFYITGIGCGRLKNNSVFTPQTIAEGYTSNFFIYGKTDTVWLQEDADKIQVMILEGDHTQNPPSYFEGLKSVGQGTDEIVVSSVNENLCPVTNDVVNTQEVLWYEWSGIKNAVTPSISKSKYKFYLGKGTYKILWDSLENANSQQITTFDGAKVIASVNNESIFTVTNGTECVLRFRNVEANKPSSITNCRIIRENTNPYYTPHQSNKKRLLYYNEETQTWEKPILREWDSIEKHADGKYYYHQRSGEVVLNGSENTWGVSQYGNNENTLAFTLVSKGVKEASVICDKFSYSFNWNDIEHVHSNTNAINITISRNKLSTQDVAGFKQWLQANNVTVVYQLAEEKVYECTNIDLITYANETNYIVESGAISPKSILKVHNNISNVVKILQEKVSLLESNVKASQEVQDMMILETDMRMLDIELALMEFAPMKLNLGGSNMLRSATYFNFLKNHIINETYEKEYLENVMNKYLATGRINQDEYDELYKMLYPPVYDIELPIEP